MSQITPELLLHGYRSGVFPMAETQDTTEIFWVAPKQRGVIPLTGFHISRSLARHLRKDPFTIRLNSDFSGVVQGCADRKTTWINAEIFDLYRNLHDLGHAHSLEVWDAEELVGGVYGVAIGGAFFGESMFSRRTNASKIALAYLVDRLRICGFTLFDTQFLTEHLASLGAVEVSQADYHRQLRNAISIAADITSENGFPSGYSLVQRSTQMSYRG